MARSRAFVNPLELLHKVCGHSRGGNLTAHPFLVPPENQQQAFDPTYNLKTPPPPSLKLVQVHTDGPWGCTTHSRWKRHTPMGHPGGAQGLVYYQLSCNAERVVVESVVMLPMLCHGKPQPALESRGPPVLVLCADAEPA